MRRHPAPLALFLMPLLLAVLIMASARAGGAVGANVKEPEPFQYEPGGHRDPFVPLVQGGSRVGATVKGTPVEPAKPILYGVLWDPGGQSIALINDKELRVGDLVADYRLLKIRQNSVVLGKGGEQMVLKITFETPPSKPSSGASPGASTGGECR